MTDPTTPQPSTETGTPGTPSARPALADHHGLVAFLGVLALILLFVGAVGAAGLTGRSGSESDSQAARPGQGNALGMQKHAEKQRLRAERQAEKRERKERQRELREQRHQSGAMGPQVAHVLAELTGTIATQSDADGVTVYVLKTATGTVVLDVGPPRYWGETHPLALLVGQTVTVTGVQKAASDAFAVFAVGDQVIRGPGRPPWAGGWKADGQKVPTTSPSPTPSPAP